MRINKYISQSGYCSRRKADQLIEQGKVTVNGEVATLGTQIPEDALDAVEVKVNKKVVRLVEKKYYLMLNKPMGIECTTNLDVEGNIISFVGFSERVFPVGRIDKNSRGLMILSNDGELSNKLMMARYGHSKKYVVKVNKPLTDNAIEIMSKGVYLKELEMKTRPCEIKKISKFVFEIVLTQGLNRQIRRMVQSVGYEVIDLQRVQIENLKLGNLKEGTWRHLTDQEVRELKRRVR